MGGTGCTLPGRPPRTHARTLDGRIGAYFVGPSTNGSDSKCSLQLQRDRQSEISFAIVAKSTNQDEAVL